MSDEQLQNCLAICKNQPISTIVNALDYWGPDAHAKFAEHFNCKNEKHEIALHLMMGR